MSNLAVTSLGSAHVCTPHHHPCDYIAGLPAWDGMPRLDSWIHRVFIEGTPRRGHSTAQVAREFVLDMVSRASPTLTEHGRVIQGPGCASPYLLVLQGKQGIGKTQALKILANDWFSNHNVLDDYHPDQAMEGAWIHEINAIHCLWPLTPRFKEFITQTHYDRREMYQPNRLAPCPRQVMLVATSTYGARLDSLNDPRVRIVQITRDSADTAWLHDNRDQLFAEAKAVLQHLAVGRGGKR